MPVSFGTSAAMKAMHGDGKVNSIRLNLICPRYSNKYINDKEEFQSLKESIKKSGLIQQITVEDIQKYISSDEFNNLDEKSKAYYQDQLDSGRKYFITVGHRRFYAYCSLCVGYDVTKKADLEQFYKDYEIATQKDAEAMEKDDIANRNKYLSIKADVASDKYFEEKEKYNASNLNQRAKKDFEIVVNSLDELKESGQFAKIEEQFKSEKIDSMQDRAVKDTLDRLGNKASWKTIDDAREILKSYDATEFPGYSQYVSKEVQEYIKGKRQKNVAIMSVVYAMSILNSYDDELLNMIFDGDFKYTTAREMTSIYRNASAEEREVIKDEIKNNTLNLRIWKNAKEPKKIKQEISNKELLKLIKQVYRKKKTIDEVYEYLVSENVI